MFDALVGAELLRRLGELAAREGLPIQTHISESDDEVAMVAALHPAGPGSCPARDTALLDAAGLVTSRRYARRTCSGE